MRNHIEKEYDKFWLQYNHNESKQTKPNTPEWLVPYFIKAVDSQFGLCSVWVDIFNHLTTNNCFYVDWSRVRPDYNYAATDADGRRFFYKTKPRVGKDATYWVPSKVYPDNFHLYCYEDELHSVNIPENFKKTLLTRPTEKPE